MLNSKCHLHLSVYCTLKTKIRKKKTLLIFYIVLKYKKLKQRNSKFKIVIKKEGKSFIK